CVTVPSISAVSVFVIDCTAIGAVPPMATGPIETLREWRRCRGMARIVLARLAAPCNDRFPPARPGVEGVRRQFPKVSGGISVARPRSGRNGRLPRWSFRFPAGGVPPATGPPVLIRDEGLQMMDSCRRWLAATLLAAATLAGAQSVAPVPPTDEGVGTTLPVEGQLPQEGLAGEAPLLPPRREDPTWSATLERIAQAAVAIEVAAARALRTEWSTPAQATGYGLAAE